ncbi:MAG: hypothetical protein JWM68_5099 [Verrucomicrobiales bacterium]|nr:hypothetical protein [Verrucomicrobiales bacterium]
MMQNGKQPHPNPLLPRRGNSKCASLGFQMPSDKSSVRFAKETECDSPSPGKERAQHPQSGAADLCSNWVRLLSVLYREIVIRLNQITLSLHQVFNRFPETH